jgi:hypothetical protein
MNLLKMKFLALAAMAMLAGCGGGGNATGGSTATTTYDFVVPQVNSQRVYGETIVDNSSNTINESYTETVLQANADGTFEVLKEDPSNNSITFNGTTYSISPETFTNNRSGQPLSYLTGGNHVTCTYSPHGAGAPYPVSIGTSWSTNFTIACNATVPNTNSFQQTGSVIDVESVTVPAGTFSALKVESTLVWTDANGMIHNAAITNWRDAATGVSVKQESTFTYGGTLSTNGYPISETIVLQSGVP